MKGYPIFLTLDDMATLIFCFLAVECQILISSWIMDLDHACTFFTQTFIFEFSSLNEAFSVCPEVPIRFFQVDGHREAQISAQFCSIQLNFTHFALD